MSIEVEAPDGSVHEFPEGTGPDIIKKAMAAYVKGPDGTKFTNYMKGQSTAAQPSRLPRFDILGDIGRDAEASWQNLKHDVGAAAPGIRDMIKTGDPKAGLATLQQNASKPLLTRFVDTARQGGNMLRIPLDVLGIAGSPVTGALKGTVGSALSYLPAAPGHDPKAEANKIVDEALSMVSPRNALAEAVEGGKALQAAESFANLKPGAAEARKAGYVLTPTMAKKSVNALESIASGEGGKVKLQQGASVKNQEVTNRLAAEDLGLPKDTTLTDKVFQDVRKSASKVYEKVARALPSVTADSTFRRSLGQLGGRNSASSAQFPGVLENPELDKMIGKLQQVKDFKPDAGLEMVSKLRFAASKNLNAIGDPNKTALGIAQRHAATAIEDLIDRNLSKNLQGRARRQNVANPLIEQYRDARRQIAKSHDIEGATNTATGDVSARGIARLQNSGRPLTGNLKTIADTANAFPKAVQNTTSFGGDEPYSALDAFAVAGSVASGHPAAALGIIARPGIRKALLSEGYQNRMIPTSPPQVPPPQNGLAFIHNAPLPGVQNQLAKGIFRAAHVNGLRALMNQPAPVAPPQE